MTTRRYTPRGYTWDPCHGCGKAESSRPKNSVCADCRRLFDFVRKREAEIAAAGDQQPQPYFMRERAYALPLMPQGNTDKRDAVRSAFFELGNLLSQTTDSDPPLEPPDRNHNYSWHDYDKWSVWPFNKTEESYNWRIVRAIRPDLAVALRATYAAVKELVADSHREGFNDGRNLINQLASGEITMDRFNDVSLRYGGKS